MKHWFLTLALAIPFLACDDEPSGDSEADMSLAGVCNPPCSPGFMCSVERICVPEGETDASVTPRPDGGNCTDECGAGEVRCSGDAIESCADGDGDGCVEWSEPVPCEAGLSCSDGLCSNPDECTDECGEGDLRCGAEGVQECRADADGDPCLDWAPEQPCGEGESCSNGVCQAGGCTDECGEGTSRCAPGGDGRQDCGEFDGDDCFEWSQVRSCGEGQSCSNGECTAIDMCSNECAEGTSECTDGNLARVECGDFDADDCLELGAPMRCGDGELCSGGDCVLEGMCDDECAEGARRCAGAGFQACRAVGDCLLWGELQACGDTEGCVDGACVQDVVDECPGVDAVRCEGDAVVSCGQFDADPALDWSQPLPCEDGETCSNGVCAAVAQCENECEVDTARCQAGGVQACGDFDADDCLDWGAVQPCDQGESCSDGICDPIEACVNECELGDAECVPGGVRGCGDFDVDDCLDWSAPTPCGDAQQCMVGACVPDDVEDQPGEISFVDPPPGAVLQGPVQLTLSALDDDGVETILITSGEELIAETQGAGIAFAQWETGDHADGPVTLVATLVDSRGNETTAERDYVVDNAAPAVEIAAPADGVRLGQPFDFTARVDDDGGVAEVRFLVDNNEVAVLDEGPWTLEIDPSDYPPAGPKTLEVVATDVAGRDGRASVDVEFAPDEITVQVLSPELGGVAARPFMFRVEAQGPDGVTQVELRLDGERLVLLNAPPYEVEIDPAEHEGMEHQLEALARDIEGREAVAAQGVTWDNEAPEVEIVRPDAGGLVTREGGGFVVEVDVTDDDPQVHVEVLVEGEVIGEAQGDPYVIQAQLGDFDPEVHEVEVDVVVRGTDYLGNSSESEVTLRFSRADLAVSALASEASMLSIGGENTMVGLYDPLRNEGRVLWMGAAGSGPAVWDTGVGSLRPIEGFFYDGIGNAGLLGEDVVLNRREFLRIGFDGQIEWRVADGTVREVKISDAGVTYLHVERPGETALVARDPNGDELFEWSPEEGRITRIAVMPNGDVVAASGDDMVGLDEVHRFDSEGELLWTFDVEGPISRFVVWDDMILLARDVGENGGTRIEMVRLGGNGQEMWSALLPEDITIQSLKPRGDGAPLVFGQNLHVFETLLHCFDPVDGDELFVFNPPGFVIITLEPFQANRAAVAAEDFREGESGAAVFQLENDGRVGSRFETGDETVLNVGTSGDSLVTVLNDGNTGESSVVVLGDDGRIVWREELAVGLGVQDLYVPAPQMADLVAFRAATNTGVLLPYGPDGGIDWRVEKLGANISQVASRPTFLVVTVEDGGGVDVLRLPRE